MCFCPTWGSSWSMYYLGITNLVMRCDVKARSGPQIFLVISDVVGTNNCHGRPHTMIRMWEISRPPRAVFFVHLVICDHFYNRWYLPTNSGTPLLAMTFEASYFWCLFGVGVQDADEEVQSLPSLLSRHQRLSGDSSSTVLIRVENSEVSVLAEDPRRGMASRLWNFLCL